ncbi:DNA-binding MarR family transcriptional regulator [Clostridium saccharoperbutylacetonicum]|uniref:Regulatory protein MarR n=1 Tax=Clostridium saccharoperbutylacetonicum N1-4(HMT) TaxID=931276 RepID=M1MPE1_9CLOT|nr:MarR family transcriptional regulator [Clostridium saccharoperbutylacetonicum]AGF58093.1 regulatory protein MarR [Clostridium saccharoperbutylacetonicum N1-4(HMT)]NRT61133.1 DNA-binding MarR family transcriptional regulator [Clostridium saccharoperbutylacetonicum]NSB24448.1 DNA-binding MarR family transcriptional regulator [Clostridium saccharoperbutylacetonicum]NSB43824.1 DNA-binding MarR family transcriptional regulator [Clostridium saccharoperbutylacetonicum]
MDKECKKQIDELNKLWHVMLTEPKYNEIEKKYENLQELSTTEISVIRIISEKEDVIIKDIVDTLRLPKSTLTSIIDRLEKRNFIVRAISDRDRRSYKLELTEKGRKVQDEHMKFEDEVYGTIILALDTFEEREELLKLIRKISINISKK